MKSGWEAKPLAELCEVFADGDWIESKDQSAEGVRLIQTGNVGEGVFKDRAEKARYISEATFKRLRCTEIFEGDCLISRLPDPAGRSCLLPDTGERMITAVDCTIVRFNRKQLYPEFFNYFSQSRDYLSAVDGETTGTTRKRISRSKLAQAVIPVPPLREQQRIVGILDKAFDDISIARASAEKNRRNSLALFESHRQSIFTRRGESWVDTALGDVCAFVRGPFGGSLKKSIFVAKGYTVYEQQHAIYDQFDDVRYFIDEAKFREMKRFELLPGDLIMSCSGTMGRVALVPSGIKRGIINQALLKLTPTAKVLNTYLKSWMGSEAFKDALKEYSGGAAIQNVASVKILKGIRIPLPSVKEQARVVDSISVFSEEIQRLAALYRRKLSALDALEQSLLHQAFTGAL